MNKTFYSAVAAIALVAAFSGCSSAPTEESKKAEVKKKEPATPVTGQSAIFQMYTVARTWDKDVMLLKVEPIAVDGMKPEKGMAGAWRATFVSTTKKMKRDYTYSVEDFSQTVIKGARAGSEAIYAANPSQRPFPIQDVKIDTPAALEAAMTDKDIKAYLEKNPDTIITYHLEWTPNAPKAAWRVILGPSVASSAMSGLVNASDGKFVKKLR
jgi:hypothetical protein